jgi:hypothetical protein
VAFLDEAFFQKSRNLFVVFDEQDFHLTLAPSHRHLMHRRGNSMPSGELPANRPIIREKRDIRFTDAIKFF